MPVQHVKAAALVQKRWGAFCFECGKRVVDEAGDALWTIWTKDMFYCPDCAKREGIGPDAY